jgi:hypothetical protein
MLPFCPVTRKWAQIDLLDKPGGIRTARGRFTRGPRPVFSAAVSLTTSDIYWADFFDQKVTCVTGSATVEQKKHWKKRNFKVPPLPCTTLAGKLCPSDFRLLYLGAAHIISAYLSFLISQNSLDVSALVSG